MASNVRTLRTRRAKRVTSAFCIFWMTGIMPTTSPNTQRVHWIYEQSISESRKQNKNLHQILRHWSLEESNTDITALHIQFKRAKNLHCVLASVYEWFWFVAPPPLPHPTRWRVVLTVQAAGGRNSPSPPRHLPTSCRHTSPEARLPTTHAAISKVNEKNKNLQGGEGRNQAFTSHGKQCQMSL